MTFESNFSIVCDEKNGDANPWKSIIVIFVADGKIKLTGAASAEEYILGS